MRDINRLNFATHFGATCIAATLLISLAACDNKVEGSAEATATWVGAEEATGAVTTGSGEDNVVSLPSETSNDIVTGRFRHVSGIKTDLYPTVTFEASGDWHVRGERVRFGDFLITGEDLHIISAWGTAQGKIAGNQIIFPIDPKGGEMVIAFAGTWEKE